MKENTPPHLKPLLFLASLALACFGCAKAVSDYDVPNPVTTPQVLKDAALCLKASPRGCFIMQVDNKNWSEAKLYLNGGRIGQLNGLSHLTLFLPIMRLDGDRCGRVVVRLGFSPDAPEGSSTKECLVGSESFVLDITPSGIGQPPRVWLIPRTSA